MASTDGGAPDAMDETFEVRISPADGAPAIPLSPGLPSGSNTRSWVALLAEFHGLSTGM